MGRACGANHAICETYMFGMRDIPQEQEEHPEEADVGIDFYDGQKVTLKVPAILLGELSVKEIAERDLFPIGQFYLRTFGKLTARKIKRFREAAEALLTGLKKISFTAT